MQVIKDVCLGAWTVLKECKEFFIVLLSALVALGLVWGMAVSPVFAAAMLILAGLAILGSILFALWWIGRDERKRREPKDKHEYLDLMGK